MTTIELLENQKAQEYTDVCARVVLMEWREMTRCIQVGKIFGKVVAPVYVIEF